MKLNRRNFIGLGAAATALPGLSASVGKDVASKSFDKKYFVNWSAGYLNMPWPGMKSKLTFRVIGDTHFAYFDKRDAKYADNYARMSGRRNVPEHLSANAPSKAFEEAITSAKKKKVDVILLVGDILSFPTLANVEYAKKKLDECGVPWIYISGNHDWHFEGLPGSSEELRKYWVENRLKPLYPEGANPYMFSRVIKGVRFVAIDNSTYLINQEQVDFWKSEAAKGDPIVLMMHIPLYVEAGSKYYCGSPYWGAAIDPYWKIERRHRWAEKATPETFAFRDAVLSTPNLAGVFTGHIHQSISSGENGQNLFSVASCMGVKPVFLDVHMY